MKEFPIGRRAFLRGAGGAAAGLAAASLVGCGTGSSRASGSAGGSKTITVRNSGGAYGDANQKALYEPFTKETGITVQVVNFEYAQMLAQIQAGRPQFDLIEDSMSDFLQFQQQNALEKLDHDRLTNFKAAGLAQNMVSDYAIGKNYWASVMAYRTDTFKTAAPQSWADFWDTAKFPGSRALQGSDADLPELEFALLADGAPMDKLYPIDVDRAFKALDRIKGSVKKYWESGSEPGLLIGRNEVAATSVWNGRLDQLIQQGNPLAYQLAGARRQSNGWAVPKGSANIDAACQLIDFSLRKDVQAAFTQNYPGVSPVVPAATDALPADLRVKLLSAPGQLEKGFDLDVDWWLKNQDAVNKRWQEWSHA